MTLQQMRYAITISDCGSMNEAAHQLFITQPSLSSTIKELEKELKKKEKELQDEKEKVEILKKSLHIFMQPHE